MTQRPQAHAHKLIYETAREMAHELYSTMMSDNEWYRVWKARNPGASPKALESRFVNANVSQLLPGAREALAACLALPGFPEDQKDQILQALILDNTLKLGRGRMVRATERMMH